MDVVDVAEPLDVLIEQHDLRLHALRDPCGVHPGHAGTDHAHPRRVDARHAGEQDPAAACGALQEMRRDV